MASRPQQHSNFRVDLSEFYWSASCLSWAFHLCENFIHKLWEYVFSSLDSLCFSKNKYTGLIAHSSFYPLLEASSPKVRNSSFCSLYNLYSHFMPVLCILWLRWCFLHSESSITIFLGELICKLILMELWPHCFAHRQIVQTAVGYSAAWAHCHLHSYLEKPLCVDINEMFVKNSIQTVTSRLVSVTHCCTKLNKWIYEWMNKTSSIWHWVSIMLSIHSM